jgi:Cu-Zn family superoxide dismutase
MMAIAVFNDKNIKGTVMFTENQKDKSIIIDVDLTGLKKNGVHGFHVHEAGDLTDSCMGACAHLNPYNTKHGGIDSKIRHVGDLGNVYADKNGNVKCQIIDNKIKMRGFKCNIIGRSIVVHEDPDDNGLGGHDDSLITGHAGKRLSCAVIGYSKKMFGK